MMYTCPWCGKTSDYTLIGDYSKLTRGWGPTKDSPIRKMECEGIECICPECGGGFNLIPQLKPGAFYVWTPFGNDWDQEYYYYDDTRKEYYLKNNPQEGRFSLSSPSKFSLAAPGKFSLFSRRRKR